MKWTKVCALFAVAGLFADVAHGQTSPSACLVRLKQPKPSLISGGPTKLSPALRATKEVNGILRGTDSSGQFVITAQRTKPAMISSLKESTSVLSVTEEIPADWTPVSRLMLSYQGENPPGAEELQGMGLKLVENYAKGSFLIVEPLGKVIDTSLINKIIASSKVEFATPDFRIRAIPPANVWDLKPAAKFEAAEPNDPRLIDCWGMKSIRAPEAWKKKHDSPVIVAILDTGVDYNHEDLKDNIWVNANGKHGYDYVDNDDDPMDLNGHGTHCAGTVGAVGNNGKGVTGVVWKIRIMAVRWLDRDGSGDVSDAIKAIDFAIENGAQILNNSWWWPEYNPSLEAAVKRAEASGAIFVASASNFAKKANNNDGDNDQETTMGRYPAALAVDNIISVAAINEAEQKSEFSHFGKKTVDLGAPGELILSTVLNNDYDGTYSGTSMAAPHVAGAVALTMAATGLRNPAEVKKLLLDNVRKIDALKDKCVTGGTLDISFLGK